ncbi:hypothetical protein ISF_01663 [Cordyceps fumosorosea ARSEF 2679]|uniref:Uncharacterized protein n=1 Tax=Cordyceps fumosorosea (strain ARSEF 2679) TaxID=1081104 RepID=A0A168DGK3_CORFA|nr:hypothetical protein ISF_01663 [Cordyceps fumosorosea ARSEF 2679]OAA72590.1 hypothetical protein ISF_01663 [Cordyceps fumosorosea ARSEF 2679]
MLRFRVAAVPRLNVRRRAEVEARADDPEEEEGADHGSDHDARDGTAGERCPSASMVRGAGDGDGDGGGCGGGLSAGERNGPRRQRQGQVRGHW